MAGKPRVAIVGAGKLGTALAVSLDRAGYKIDAVIARNRRTSLRNAQQLATEVGTRVLADGLRDLRAEVIWLCVPDSAIASAAKEIAAKWKGKGKVALHSSGALTSDELDVLRRRGAAIASVHPMMTFVRGAFFRNSKPQESKFWKSEPGRWKSAGLKHPLAGVPFAIEGDASAVRVAKRIVGDMGGTAYPIRKADKAAYHAWGTFASPLFTALLVTTEKVAGLAGVKGKAARKRMMPILLQTLGNYATRDASDAFSGPIIRGDVDTMKRHLHVLRAVPVAREVYVSLAQAAIRYLPARNKKELIRLLDADRCALAE